MSHKSRRPAGRPHSPPLPILTQHEVERLLIGPPPTCCEAHVTAHAQHRAFIAGTAAAPCFLCGSLPAGIRGFFAPANSQQYGAPVGKKRLLAYQCCEPCWRLPDREAQVEARALQDVRRGQARWN